MLGLREMDPVPLSLSFHKRGQGREADRAGDVHVELMRMGREQVRERRQRSSVFHRELWVCRDGSRKRTRCPLPSIPVPFA